MECEGLFIAISGIDGSGKTTLQEGIKKMLQCFSDKEILCLDGMKPLRYTNVLKQYAELNEKNMFNMFEDVVLLSYAMSLLYNYVYIIKPALIQGKIVITHRNDMCCKAYTKLRDIESSAMPIVREMLSTYRKADLHFYCNVDVDLALSRIETRKREGYIPSINENKKKLLAIQSNYEELIHSEYKHVTILNTIEEHKYDVEQSVLERILKDFGYKL